MEVGTTLNTVMVIVQWAFFELPNHWNGNIVGGLLAKIPPPDSGNLSYQNNDETLLLGGSPAGSPVDPTPSPFLTAILAVFGPNTFFNTVALNSSYSDPGGLVCKQLRYPFTGLSIENTNSEGIDSFYWNQTDASLECREDTLEDDPAPPLLQALLTWLPNFGDDATATGALTMATYSASNAILNVRPRNTGFFLYGSVGTSLQKPTMPVAAMAIITLLLATQIAGLALLAIYASRRPVWSETLDAWAMLRIGAKIGSDLPSVSGIKAQHASVLDGRNGWIGDAGIDQKEGDVKCRDMVLGGSESVKAGVMYRMSRERDREEDDAMQ